ncbi:MULTISPECIES: hypothetical protein [Paenibacillus]|uniref:hypothetical protein n=1 Tax=Paenibacillus TaxID=44249 RepID=UPI0003D35410|nr:MULTISPECIES: hypothetical protein [Paenibacillus]AHC18498.1 hypothetical protein X809_04170 [Paenibacillus polymyxa CR1]APB77505.1 hypothetical protein PPYC2_22255 [Paenibacillus polymyxa]OMF69525.1 hypothetical protein BK143_20605 [Paenibacillus peoriae]OMF76541.1 hypothetical protein BK145_21620 [Paenibacillus peoriae]POR26448.1 hypothetical protein CG775_17805 [Paenibacillus polymyxa]
MKAKAYIILLTAVISLAALLTACGDSKKQIEGESTTGAATATTTTTQNAKVDNAEQAGVDGVVSNTTDQATKGNGKTYSDVAKEATKPDRPAGQIGLNTTQEQLLTFADRYGLVRVQDHPIRRVSDPTGKQVNIANYSDSVVNLYTEEPIHLNTDEFIHEAYNFFTEGVAPGESYKKWEETSNTERGLVKMLYLSREGLHILEEAMRTHDYSSPSVQNTLGFFKVASKFESMMPVAQTPTDISLYDMYDQRVKPEWKKLSDIKNPAANEKAFAAAYQKARDETNNLMGLLNIMVSTEMEKRLKAATDQQNTGK